MSVFKVLAAACVATGLIAISAPDAWSQSKSVKIVVPYTPGSGPDITSRLMAEQIGRMQGATIVIENRPGGGTVIGTELAARAAPDGATVLMIANSFVANPAVNRGNYHPTNSFDPVCQLAVTPMVLVVQASSPYKTLDDLLAAARKEPGKLSLASGGPASSLHFGFEIVKRAAKVDMTYVPYGGTAPSINALMGGHVTSVFADYPTVVSQLKAGTLRGLVTTSPTRVDELPGVPTLTETGLIKYEDEIFYGIVAPVKTPPEALKQLSAWFTAAMDTAEVKPKLAQQGLFAKVRCGSAFDAAIKSKVEDYTRVAREANIKVN
jgi:tripartite-type tricarboxylate transporter receptor subunit TctC